VFTDLEIFRMSSGMARHAGARQTVVAENLAHLNTPGYRTKDIASFAESLQQPSRAQALQTSRPGHRPGTDPLFASDAREVRDAVTGIDGNSVSVESEIMKTAEIRQQHDMALAIYRSALSIVRGSLGQR